MLLSFRETFYQLRFFFIPLVMFWIASGIALAVYGYNGSFVMLNHQFHNQVTDFAGLYLTHLADAVLLPLIILIWTWKKDRSLFFTAIVLTLFTGLTAVLLKLAIFAEWHRPPLVFKELQEIMILPEHPPKRHSFPSGHATVFGAGGIIFAWYFRDRSLWWSLGVGLFTIVLAYTRVHLGVHFLGDIMVGTMIGAIFGGCLLSVSYERIKHFFESKLKDRADALSIWILTSAIIIIAIRFFVLAKYSS